MASSSSIQLLLDYTQQRYESTLKTIGEFGDVTIDDVTELMIRTHDQLKELVRLLIPSALNTREPISESKKTL